MEFTVNLQANRVARRLLFVVLGLILLSALGRILLFHLKGIPGVYPLAMALYLDEEGNLPTIYATLALGLATVLLGLIARFEQQRASITARSWRRLSWIFCYIMCDELFSLHELLIQPLQRLGFKGFLHYAWVVPAMGVVALFGLWSIQFLRQLDRATRHRLMLSGSIYIVGALGFEMLNGNVVSQLGEAGVLFDPLYQVLMSCEEGLEKLGIVLFIHTLLRHLNQRHGIQTLHLRFFNDRPMPGTQGLWPIPGTSASSEGEWEEPAPLR